MPKNPRFGTPDLQEAFFPLFEGVAFDAKSKRFIDIGSNME